MINSTAKIIRFEWNLSGHIMRQNMANSSSTKRKDILCLQFYNTIVYLLLFSYCLPCSPMNLMEYNPNNVAYKKVTTSRWVASKKMTIHEILHYKKFTPACSITKDFLYILCLPPWLLVKRLKLELNHL